MDKEPIRRDLHPRLLHKQLPSLTRALVDRIHEIDSPVAVEIRVLPSDRRS